MEKKKVFQWKDESLPIIESATTDLGAKQYYKINATIDLKPTTKMTKEEVRALVEDLFAICNAYKHNAEYLR